MRGTLAYLMKSWLPARVRRQPAVRATARWLLERLRHVAFAMLAVAEFAC